MKRPSRSLLALLVGPPLLLAATSTPAASAATTLRGTFALQAGSCGGGAVTGSYFRMILHSGGPSGPFLGNSSSTCSDQTYTLLAPGTDGGLRTGSYQQQPSPAFDANGNGLADRITQPTRFYGVGFATSTNPVDPQTHRSVTPPAVTADGSALSADLRAFTVAWNSQQFNQGSPKPDGTLPGNTRRATGSYDAATGSFTLQWTSQIQGGPFDGFTGLWHLTGRFTPAGERVVVPPAARPSTAAPAPAGTTARTAAPQPVTSPTSAATAAPTRSGTPSATAGSPSAAGVTATGAPAATSTPPNLAQTRTASSHGTTRWPWVLVAVVLAAASGGLVLRLRSPR